MSHAKAICEEYCKSVRESRGNLTVALDGKYFTELYSRLMMCGYCCESIMTTGGRSNENHLARFVPMTPDTEVWDVSHLLDIDAYEAEDEDEDEDWKKPDDIF
jgi:hypothetical protein